MTPQEIKQNMTQGEWKNSGLHFKSVNEASHIHIGQTFVTYNTVKFRQVDDGSGEANAAAIVSAVNGTFGVGIDPSKVKEMYELLQSMNNHLKQWSVIKSDSPYVVDIVNLLNSAKL